MRRRRVEPVRQRNGPVVSLDGRDREALGRSVPVLADLELNLERRLALEPQHEVVVTSRRELVVHAETVLGAVSEAGGREGPDVLLDADDAVLAADGRLEACSVG